LLYVNDLRKKSARNIRTLGFFDGKIWWKKIIFYHFWRPYLFVGEKSVAWAVQFGVKL
jgi:hypothetical protein